MKKSFPYQWVYIALLFGLGSLTSCQPDDVTPEPAHDCVCEFVNGEYYDTAYGTPDGVPEEDTALFLPDGSCWVTLHQGSRLAAEFITTNTGDVLVFYSGSLVLEIENMCDSTLLFMDGAEDRVYRLAE